MLDSLATAYLDAKRTPVAGALTRDEYTGGVAMKLLPAFVPETAWRRLSQNEYINMPLGK
jgi:hypothetical protein